MCITCSLIHCLQTHCPGETTSVLRYSPLILVSHTLIQWSWKMKHMRHYPYSFSSMGYLQWYLKMPRRSSKASSTKSSDIIPLSTDLAIYHMVECSREKNKRTGKRFLKAMQLKASIRLWDVYFELESYTWSNAAHGISKLNGEVPETVMSEEISNISQFRKFEWL